VGEWRRSRLIFVENTFYSERSHVSGEINLGANSENNINPTPQLKKDPTATLPLVCHESIATKIPLLRSFYCTSTFILLSINSEMPFLLKSALGYFLIYFKYTR
jgi:hypothetical protein